MNELMRHKMMAVIEAARELAYDKIMLDGVQVEHPNVVYSWDANVAVEKVIDAVLALDEEEVRSVCSL